MRTVKYFLDSAESCHMIQKSHAMRRSCQLSINSLWVLKAIKCIKIFGKPESWEHFGNWNYSAIAPSIILLLLLLSLPFWLSSPLLLLTPSPLHNCSATQLSLSKEISWSAGTIVSTVTMLQAGQSGFQIQVGAGNLSPQCPHWVWGPPSLLHKGHQGSFLGVMLPGCEINHSPQTSAKIKNGWRNTSAPCICLHSVDKGNFTFYLNHHVSSIHVIWMSQKVSFSSWTLPIV